MAKKKSNRQGQRRHAPQSATAHNGSDYPTYSYNRVSSCDDVFIRYG